MMRIAAVACAAIVLLPVQPAAARAVPPDKGVWLADVHRALAGSHHYIRKRAARGGGDLAINVDIDNTALATHYDAGQPVRDVLRLTRYAHRHGVSLLVNTARPKARSLKTRRQLLRAGYAVDELCSRVRGETVVEGKQRCRRRFVKAGFTIIANVGNRPTDFAGGNYERAFRLPNYGGALS